MSSSNPSDASNQKPNQQEQHTSETSSQAQSQSQTETPLPLPAPQDSNNTTTIDMSSGANTVKLDHLGPLVVNKDGTMSRINNWAEMADIERQNTLRVLGKRNQLRREALLEKEGAEK